MTLQPGEGQPVPGHPPQGQPAAGAQQSIVDPRRLYMTFKSRMDRVAIYSASRMVSMQIKKGDWEIVERVKAHLGGQCRLGIYNHLPDNTCLWAVVIFDERTGTPTARDSLFFATQAARIGLAEVKRERTKVKGENYQCWLFFEKPVAAKKVRYVLTTFLKKLGIKMAEVLPNEDELTTGSVGNFAWLPYFGGIDKWITDGGDTRVDVGMKQGYTVFLDTEGNPEKNPFGTIHRYTEDELDNVITYLQEYIPPEPSPDEGIKILDSHLRKLSEKCDAFKNMQAEIKDRRMLRDEGLATLGIMMKYLDRADFLHKLLIKTADYDKGFYERKLETLTGKAFPVCSIFKKIGYCPEGKDCFEPRPPLLDRFGKFEEDRNKPKEVWREPSPVLWIFQGIKERMGEEGDIETAVIDVDIKSYEEYLLDLQEEMGTKRAALLSKQRGFSGLDTGFFTLNQVLDGLKEDMLITVAGNPGAGKTIFCTQLLEQVAQAEGVSCCYISFGETKELITIKTLSRVSNIDYRKIQRGTFSDEEVKILRQASEKIRGSFGRFIFIIEGNDSLGMKKIREIIDFANPKLIIIDSLQAFPYVGKQRPSDHLSRLELTMQQFKTLARYQKIPLIIAHATLEKDNGDSNNMESLILNMSDVYINLMNKTQSGPDSGQREINIQVRKNRGGERNISLRFSLHTLTQKFTEIR